MLKKGLYLPNLGTGEWRGVIEEKVRFWVPFLGDPVTFKSDPVIFKCDAVIF